MFLIMLTFASSVRWPGLNSVRAPGGKPVPCRDGSGPETPLCALAFPGLAGRPRFIPPVQHPAAAARQRTCPGGNSVVLPPLCILQEKSGDAIGGLPVSFCVREYQWRRVHHQLTPLARAPPLTESGSPRMGKRMLKRAGISHWTG